MFVDGTLEQDEDANPTAALSRAYRRVIGEAPSIYRKNAFNDTIRFAERGQAAITFGPGEDGWPPINEYIHIDKAVAATKILALTDTGLDRNRRVKARALTPTITCKETIHDPP